jgi:hypothetical protein
MFLCENRGETGIAVDVLMAWETLGGALHDDELRTGFCCTFGGSVWVDIVSVFTAFVICEGV